MRSLLFLPLVASLGCFVTSCFVRGTRVSTPRGDRPIEDLRTGDEVHAWNGREIVVRKITGLHHSLAREVREIVVDGARRSGVTLEHPYWVIDRGWTRVRDLAPNDRVLLKDGREARIESIHAIEHAVPDIEVFNITVEEPESNYFADDILVHNKSIALDECGSKNAITQQHVSGDRFTITVQLVKAADLSITLSEGMVVSSTSSNGRLQWIFDVTVPNGKSTRASIQTKSGAGGCFFAETVTIYHYEDAGYDGSTDSGMADDASVDDASDVASDAVKD